MLLETELERHRNRPGAARAAACTFGGTRGKRSPSLRPQGRNRGQEAWRPAEATWAADAEGRGKGSPRNQTSGDSRDGNTGGEGQGPGALPSFMGGLGGLVQAPQSRRGLPEGAAGPSGGAGGRRQVPLETHPRAPTVPSWPSPTSPTAQHWTPNGVSPQTLLPKGHSITTDAGNNGGIVGGPARCLASGAIASSTCCLPALHSHSPSRAASAAADTPHSAPPGIQGLTTLP